MIFPRKSEHIVKQLVFDQDHVTEIRKERPLATVAIAVEGLGVTAYLA